MEREDEVEAQAPEIGLASRRSRPHQHVNTSTTTTITTDDCGSFSEHYCGERKIALYLNKELHSKPAVLLLIGVDFCDSKTSTGHVRLDLTAKESGIQNSGGINLKDEEKFKNKRTPVVNSPRSKDSLQDQNANDTFIKNETTEPGKVNCYFTQGSELKESNIERENKRLDTDEFDLRKLKACIKKVLFCPIKCPSCFRRREHEEWGEARMSRAPNPGIKRGGVTVLPPPPP